MGNVFGKRPRKLTEKQHRAEAARWRVETQRQQQIRENLEKLAEEIAKENHEQEKQDLHNRADEANQLMKEAKAHAVLHYFAANNLKKPKGLIDLHDLYIEEAVQIVEDQLQKFLDSTASYNSLTIIAGHGPDPLEDIESRKDAVMDVAARLGLKFTDDFPSLGCVTVETTPQQERRRSLRRRSSVVVPLGKKMLRRDDFQWLALLLLVLVVLAFALNFLAKKLVPGESAEVCDTTPDIGHTDYDPKNALDSCNL